jgi:hypothetical protein
MTTDASSLRGRETEMESDIEPSDCVSYEVMLADVDAPSGHVIDGAPLSSFPNRAINTSVLRVASALAMRGLA